MGEWLITLAGSLFQNPSSTIWPQTRPVWTIELNWRACSRKHLQIAFILHILTPRRSFICPHFDRPWRKYHNKSFDTVGPPSPWQLKDWVYTAWAFCSPLLTFVSQFSNNTCCKKFFCCNCTQWVLKARQSGGYWFFWSSAASNKL